jgi:WD40 repeat protein
VGKGRAQGAGAIVCGAIAAVAGCAALFAGKSGPFWSTDELKDVLPPSGLLAAVLADNPLPRAPLPDELQAVEATPPIRLERVLGRPAMDPGGGLPVAFLPDGRRLISIAAGELRIWDPVTRTQLTKFPACDKGLVTALAVSRDGRLAAAAIAPGRICVRDLVDGHVVRSWEAHTAPIKTLTFVTGGQLISYAYERARVAETQMGPMLERAEEGGELRRWRLDEERPDAQFVVGPASAVRAAADGSVIVVRDLTGTLRALDAGGRLLWTGKRGEHFDFTFVDHDRQLLVLGSGPVRLLDARTGGDLGALKAMTALPKFWPNGQAGWKSSCLAVTPDGRRAITALHDDPYFFIWDLATRREVEHPHSLNFPACTGTFSPDGTLLVTPDLQLWDATARLPLPDRSTNVLAVSADGRRAITEGTDLTMRLWDIERGAAIARRRLTKGVSVALSAPGDKMLLGFENGWVRLYDVATGAELWSLDGRAGGGPWSLSPDGRLAVTSTYKGGLVVHDVTTGKGLWNTPLPDHERAATAFSPDGKLLAHTDLHHQVMVRIAQDGREVRRFPEVKRRWRLAFSPDGRYLLADAGETVIYDLAAEGKEVRRVPYPGGLMVVGPGLLVFSQSHGSRTIELSRLSDGTVVGKLTLGERFGVVSSMAMSAAGSRLLVGTSRGQTLVFAMNGSLN